MEHEEFMTIRQSMEDRFKDFTNVAVETIMTRSVVTIPTDIEALAVGATMLARRVKQPPVVQNPKVIGIISHKHRG
jgi:CBS domain-containing protein